MDRKIVSVLCLFDFFDGSFSVIQPKASLPIFSGGILELSNEKISRQIKCFVSFSVKRNLSPSAYINIAFGGIKST